MSAMPVPSRRSGDDYLRSRGYAPLQPTLAELPPLLDLDSLTRKFNDPDPHSVSDGISGRYPLNSEQVAAADIARAHRRQRLVDFHVTAMAAQRESFGGEEQCRQWTVAELGQIARGAAVAFRTADGVEHSVTALEAARAARTFARLSGRYGIGGGFFSTNSAAVLAHAVHLTRCDTPLEAIGETAWSAYLCHVGGDAQRARHSVAADIAELLCTATETAAFVLRTDEDRRGQIVDMAATAVDRWKIDSDRAWAALPGSTWSGMKAVVDALLLPREELADEPFMVVDPYLHSAAGSLYGAEQGAVDRLAESAKRLDHHGDRQLLIIVDELIARAQSARDLPTTTLVDRVERQWRLLELADAAERLADDPALVDAVSFMNIPAPNQLPLLELSDFLAVSSPARAKV